MPPTSTPIVLEVGTWMTRLGFGGDSRPTWEFPSIIGFPKEGGLMKDLVPPQPEFYAGDEVRPRISGLKLVRPLAQGIIKDWHALEKFWEFIRTKKLGDRDHHAPIRVIKSPFAPPEQEQLLRTIIARGVAAPSVEFCDSASLALFSEGASSGIVVDIAADATRVVPVHHGQVQAIFMRETPLGGQDVTRNLLRAIHRTGHWPGTSELMHLDEMKEVACLVVSSPGKEVPPTRTFTFTFTGATIELQVERRIAPEVLFHPEMVGKDVPPVHGLLAEVLENVQRDLKPETSKLIRRTILLVGGTSLLPGLQERITREIKDKCPELGAITIITPPQSDQATWRGGSLLPIP